MTQFNSEINQYNINNQNPNPRVQTQRTQMPVRIPAYYAQNDIYEPKTFKEAVKEADMMGNITPFFENPVAVIATWLGLGLGIDAYSNACKGNYTGSLVQRAANLGDKIEQSKFVQSKPSQKVLDGFRYLKKLGSKAVDNSAVLRAMKNTPSMPEWGLVKGAMYNQEQEIVQDFLKIVDKLHLDSNEPISMVTKGTTIDINAEEKEMLKKVFKVDDISKVPESKVINQVLLKRLGYTQEQIDKIHALGDNATQATKKEILKAMGLTADDIKNIKNDDIGATVNKVKEAAGKVKNKVRIGGGQYKILGPYLSKPFSRTISCDEVYNKLHSMSGGAKTGTGRFLSKGMQTMHRGLTWGQGKLAALLFIAPELVTVMKHVQKADKSEKLGTAVNETIEVGAWVITMPIAIRMMHAVGGIQYAGLSKENVEKCREIVKEFNKKNAELGFKTKAEYKSAKLLAEAKIDKLRKFDKPQNLLTKGLRKVARFMTMDLGNFDGYKSSNFVKTWGWHKLGKLPKNLVGVPLRFGIWLGLTGAMGSLISKGVKAVFGKYHDQSKDETKLSEKKQQKAFLKQDLNRRLYEAQKQKQEALYEQYKLKTNNSEQGKRAVEKTVSPYSAKGKTENSSLTFDVIEPQTALEETVDNYTYIPSSKNVIPQPVKPDSVDNYTYIPSSECTIPSDGENASAAEKQRKYIPSQEAANIQKNFDNSGLQSALDRAQRAEDKALRVLAGNFDEM